MPSILQTLVNFDVLRNWYFDIYQELIEIALICSISKKFAKVCQCKLLQTFHGFRDPDLYVWEREFRTKIEPLDGENWSRNWGVFITSVKTSIMDNRGWCHRDEILDRNLVSVLSSCVEPTTVHTTVPLSNYWVFPNQRNHRRNSEHLCDFESDHLDSILSFCCLTHCQGPGRRFRNPCFPLWIHSEQQRS